MANINEFIVTDEKTDKRIRDGIEKNRKGNFNIRVKAGDKVTVKLVNHKFRFGANLFMLDEFPDDKRKNEIYKKKFSEIFNLATLPFYWEATEPEEGKTRYEKTAKKIYRRPPIDLCIAYCKENNIEPREHALCYEHFFPKWLQGKTNSEVKECLENRMEQISLRYAKDIPTIEVTNEMFWGESVTPFYFSPEFMTYCYELADKYFPKNELCINEWSGIWDGGTPRDQYYLIIENLLLKGLRIDAIGMQYHMFFRKENYFNATRNYYNLPHLFHMLDSYSAFEKPIQITEITIPAHTAEQEDEQLQADIIEKLYSLWFSYPNIEQIIYWNLVDGYAAFSEPGNMEEGENYYRGGLLRFDMSEKLSYKRLKHLIQDVWTTNEQITADSDGIAKFRGFYGEYEITVNGKTVKYNFDTDGKEVKL